jgi:hypothetical protein
VLIQSIIGMKKDTRGSPYVLHNLPVNLQGRHLLECVELYSEVLIVCSPTKRFNKAIIPLGDWEDINKVGCILYNLWGKLGWTGLGYQATQHFQ